MGGTKYVLVDRPPSFFKFKTCYFCKRLYIYFTYQPFKNFKISFNFLNLIYFYISPLQTVCAYIFIEGTFHKYGCFLNIQINILVFCILKTNEEDLLLKYSMFEYVKLLNIRWYGVFKQPKSKYNNIFEQKWLDTQLPKRAINLRHSSVEKHF